MKYIAEISLRTEARFMWRLAKYYRGEARRLQSAGVFHEATSAGRIAWAFRESFRAVLSVLKRAPAYYD